MWVLDLWKEVSFLSGTHNSVHYREKICGSPLVENSCNIYEHTQIEDTYCLDMEVVSLCWFLAYLCHLQTYWTPIIHIHYSCSHGAYKALLYGPTSNKQTTLTWQPKNSWSIFYPCWVSRVIAALVISPYYSVCTDLIPWKADYVCYSHVSVCFV